MNATKLEKDQSSLGKPLVQGERQTDKHNVQETDKDCKMCHQNEKWDP